MALKNSTPLIQIDSQDILDKKLYWGKRLIVFSMLITVLMGAIGFYFLVTTPYGAELSLPGSIARAIVGLVSELLGPLGVITGVVVIASRKKPPVNHAAMMQSHHSHTIAVEPISAQAHPSAVTSVVQANRVKLVIAIVCFTVPGLVLISALFIGILSAVGAGDGTPSVASQSIGSVLSGIAVVGYLAFLPGIIIGVLLLVNRRKVVPHATN